MNNLPELRIENGYIPGSIGRVAELHGAYYHEHWGFGIYFEAKVATELAVFLQRYNKIRDGFWLAIINGRIEGSVAIDGINAEDEGAHLRWFILSDTLKGKGVGRELLGKALAFCKIKGYQKVYLQTFEGLDAARHLYEEFGFKLIKQKNGKQWGTAVNEHYFILTTE